MDLPLIFAYGSLGVHCFFLVTMIITFMNSKVFLVGMGYKAELIFWILTAIVLVAQPRENIADGALLMIGFLNFIRSFIINTQIQLAVKERDKKNPSE